MTEQNNRNLKIKAKYGLALIVQIFIWLIVLNSFFYAWKYPDQVEKIFPGLKLPTINFSNIIKALVFISIVLYVFRFIKHLILRWTDKHAQNNRSVYYSMVTIIGYIGWIVATWGTLSFLGLNLQNLAIVFGALSVGIGFGLQTIVNNFVSGLLILFERPIAVGDWIKVGSQEGVVKSIRIRSTEIETFDKSCVLIPNSSILSTDVVNVTQRNKMGRIIIPVGVSYSSDMNKVRDVLLKCTQNIEGVDLVKNPPVVFMTEFADSSVNFELRVHIKDANQGLGIRSALMFEIWNAFEKEKIEIPFPQQVVHMEKE